MPTSMIAAISNVVATGRRINGRDGLIERNYAGTLTHPSLARRGSPPALRRIAGEGAERSGAGEVSCTDRTGWLIACRDAARRLALHPAAGPIADLRLLPNPPAAARLGRPQPAAVPCAGRQAHRRRAFPSPSR